MSAKQPGQNIINFIYQHNLEQYRRLMACAYYNALYANEHPERLSIFRERIKALEEELDLPRHAWPIALRLIELKAAYVMSMTPEERPSRLEASYFRIAPSRPLESDHAALRGSGR